MLEEGAAVGSPARDIGAGQCDLSAGVGAQLQHAVVVGLNGGGGAVGDAQARAVTPADDPVAFCEGAPLDLDEVGAEEAVRAQLGAGALVEVALVAARAHDDHAAPTQALLVAQPVADQEFAGLLPGRPSDDAVRRGENLEGLVGVAVADP